MSASPIGSQERKLTIDGTDRNYLLYTPAALDRSKPSPLVIFLHGSGGNAYAAEQSTQFSIHAEKQRFVVAYPSALSRSGVWNIGCCNEAFEQKINDLGFIHQIVERTAADLAIDPDRVYIAGWSAGGAMAYSIVCDAPERFAAIGTVAGSLLRTDCAPRAELSVVQIHGTKDQTSPYGGCSPTTVPCANPSATRPAVEPMMARVRELFACPAPTVARDGPVTRTTATPCRSGTEITLMTVEGGVHDGPLGSATGGTMASADVPALVTFFFAHPRPSRR